MSRKAHTLSIIFHGNDIDGWMSAYVVSNFHNRHLTKFFPVSPTKTESWPSPDDISETTFIVSTVPSLKLLTEYGRRASKLYVIDHHASSMETLSKFSGFMTVHNVSQCSTESLYKMLFPKTPVPDWIGLVDRLARWQTPSLQDKALREVLHPIACFALNVSIEAAMERTNIFLAHFASPTERELLVRQGLDILSMKDETLANVLRKGQIFEITDSLISTWSLPRKWTGLSVFVLNNTGIIIDSTLAASKVFDENPTVHIFVNYRTREVVHPCTGLPVTEYSYCARARNSCDIDLTENGIFAGHACSAGARYFSGQTCELPFIL